MSKLAMVKRLIAEGKSVKEVAVTLYGDGTEVGRRRVRAILSKLKKGKASNITSTSSNNRYIRSPKEERKGAQPGCCGVALHRNPLVERNSFVDRNRNSSSSQPSEVVRAPAAGLGCRVGWVLERDVVTAVLCDNVVAGVVKRFAHRVTGAGFYLYHEDGVAFQAKGDVVAISEPTGDVEKASKVLERLLTLANIHPEQIKQAVLRLKHPSQIGYEELAVDIFDPEIIEIIRRLEPHIPDPGRGVYVIHAPSPVMPGLKIYLRSHSQLRIELVAHNEKQAFNAFFIRGEFVGDVLPHLKRSPGIFDEWRAQYWSPYSHPMVLNIILEVSKAAYKRGAPEGAVTTFDSLPPEVKKAISSLRDRGVLWYNDFRFGMSDKLKRAYRRDPARVMGELGYADLIEREITLLLLQKTVIEYELLLRYLKHGECFGLSKLNKED